MRFVTRVMMMKKKDLTLYHLTKIKKVLLLVVVIVDLLLLHYNLIHFLLIQIV